MRLALLVLVGACGGGPSIPTGPIIIDGPGGGGDGSGRFMFSWRVEQDGSLASCLNFGATEVEVTTFSNNTGNESSLRFPCNAQGNEMTNLLSTGPYQINAVLFDSSQSTINTAQGLSGNIVDDNTINVGTFIFDFGVQ